MMYSCNDLLHTFFNLTCSSAYYMLYHNSQYISILWVQYIDMAKYNIVTALMTIHCIIGVLCCHWSVSFWGQFFICWNFNMTPLWSNWNQTLVLGLVSFLDLWHASWSMMQELFWTCICWPALYVHFQKGSAASYQNFIWTSGALIQYLRALFAASHPS